MNRHSTPHWRSKSPLGGQALTEGISSAQTVSEAQSRLAKVLDKQIGHPVAESRLLEPGGKEKGADDEPDDWVCEGSKTSLEGQRLGRDGDRETAERPCSDRKGL